ARDDAARKFDVGVRRILRKHVDRGLGRVERLRPADRGRERRPRRLKAARDPVPLDAVVHAVRDDEEVVRIPRAGHVDALTDERTVENPPRRHDVIERHDLLGLPLGYGVRREGPGQLPLQKPGENARNDEAEREEPNPPRAKHDLAQGGRELFELDLVVGRVSAHSYGVTTTSTRWNSFSEEYPVVAMARRSAPMRFVVPSAVVAGPNMTSSRVAFCATATRRPRGRVAWCAS